jgi:predicted SprT family Zn-dependent metalloprotease
MDIDVTDLVSFGNNDDEVLPLTKCVCGKEFESWRKIISIYREHAGECSNCHRKLYFKNRIRIYEIND